MIAIGDSVMSLEYKPSVEVFPKVVKNKLGHDFPTEYFIIKLVFYNIEL